MPELGPEMAGQFPGLESYIARVTDQQIDESVKRAFAKHGNGYGNGNGNGRKLTLERLLSLLTFLAAVIAAIFSAGVNWQQIRNVTIDLEQHIEASTEAHKSLMPRESAEIRLNDHERRIDVVEDTHRRERERP